jgi:hypothetical protein
MIKLEQGCYQMVDEVSRKVATFFADGTALVAEPPKIDTPEFQEAEARARSLGYDGWATDAVWKMTLDHDLLHMLLAQAEGLPHSPTLYAVAKGEPVDAGVADLEERRVLFIQRLLNEGAVS